MSYFSIVCYNTTSYCSRQRSRAPAVVTFSLSLFILQFFFFLGRGKIKSGGKREKLNVNEKMFFVFFPSSGS